ncbi:response regulator [Sphingomonas sp. ac-8]|uniref:response regulator transcription factor n=1 Tax=Sphingomonas sp. ac-8 TaxID=3242977 RepID=UPI003A7FC25D
MTPRTILVADDHPLFRQALKLAIGRAAPDATVLEAGQLHEALEQAAAAPRLDLVTLDLRMPGADGFSGVAQLHAERPGTPILVVSSADAAEAAHRARAYGATGFVSKTAELAELERAVARALDGVADPLPEPTGDAPSDIATRIASLTPTELKVLTGVMAGKLNKQIAFQLSVSEATVKGHMTAILRKLGVLNRTQAVLAARTLDLAIED